MGTQKFTRTIPTLPVALALLALAGCDSDNTKQPKPLPVTWEAGPVIGGVNYSPKTIVSDNKIFIPADGRTGTIARRGSLAGMSKITLRFTLNAPITTATEPKGPGLVTVYFQRKGDNWSAQGQYETYRWYATFATVTTNGAGSYEAVAPLSGRWTAVETSNSIDHAAAFKDAVANADKVGFVLGGGTGYAHGVTGPATMTVTDFVVE